MLFGDWEKSRDHSTLRCFRHWLMWLWLQQAADLEDESVVNVGILDGWEEDELEEE
jgi:hypothetical protein